MYGQGLIRVIDGRRVFTVGYSDDSALAIVGEVKKGGNAWEIGVTTAALEMRGRDNVVRDLTEGLPHGCVCTFADVVA